MTEDLETVKRRTRQARGAPPPLATFGERAWPTAPSAAVMQVLVDRLVQELVWLGWRSVDAVTLRAEGKVGFLVALPLLYTFLGLPALSYATKEEPDNALRALMLLVHALFHEAYGDTEEPGMAIMSVHHKASIAKEGGFTWFSRACSCDREAVALIEADVGADLVARA